MVNIRAVINTIEIHNLEAPIKHKIPTQPYSKTIKGNYNSLHLRINIQVRYELFCSRSLLEAFSSKQYIANFAVASYINISTCPTNFFSNCPNSLTLYCNTLCLKTLIELRRKRQLKTSFLLLQSKRLRMYSKRKN